MKPLSVSGCKQAQRPRKSKTGVNRSTGTVTALCVPSGLDGIPSKICRALRLARACGGGQGPCMHGLLFAAVAAQAPFALPSFTTCHPIFRPIPKARRPQSTAGNAATSPPAGTRPCPIAASCWASNHACCLACRCSSSMAEPAKASSPKPQPGRQAPKCRPIVNKPIKPPGTGLAESGFHTYHLHPNPPCPCHPSIPKPSGSTRFAP